MFAVACVAAFTSWPADARRFCNHPNAALTHCSGSGQGPIDCPREYFAACHNTRPAECIGIPWCGCWLRLRYGITDKAFDKASNWRNFGQPSLACVVGGIAYWPHHVGEITGCPGGGQIQIISGNDGNAVRDRLRSIRGARFRTR